MVRLVNPRPTALFAAVALLAAALGSSADASPVTFSYFGNVTNYDDGITALPAPFNNPNIVVGSPVAITYTFESTSPDTAAGTVTGVYYSVSQIVLTIGPATNTWNFTSPLARLYVGNDMGLQNNITTDRYALLATNLGPGYDQLSFQLDDTSYSVFNSDAQPLVQPPASAFNYSVGQLEATGFIPGFIHFNLTATPEPASLVAGALALPLMRRRRV